MKTKKTNDAFELFLKVAIMPLTGFLSRRSQLQSTKQQQQILNTLDHSTTQSVRIRVPIPRKTMKKQKTKKNQE